MISRLCRLLCAVPVLFCGALAADGDMLSVGSDAPDFTLQGQSGDSVTLSAFQNKQYVVLVFYPGDQTPVCTKQLCAIRDDYSQFKNRNAVVFGINYADSKSHTAFSTKNSLDFPLLIDTGYGVTKKYGCKGAIMAIRTVYVVGLDGKIIYALRGKPATSEILKAIPAASKEGN